MLMIIVSPSINYTMQRPSRWWPVWDQEVCFLCYLKFEPRGCLYDDH
jgi:hypothetical protein